MFVTSGNVIFKRVFALRLAQQVVSSLLMCLYYELGSADLDHCTTRASVRVKLTYVSNNHQQRVDKTKFCYSWYDVTTLITASSTMIRTVCKHNRGGGGKATLDMSVNVRVP
jgi:hypothetical protein